MKKLMKIKKHIERKVKEAIKIRDTRNTVANGLILHLDGDKRYTQKSQKYYNKLGLRAIVKNIPENRQPQVIR